MAEEIKSICIIGSGNVAWHLCSGLLKEKVKILGVFSKTEKNSINFSREFNIQSYPSIQSIPKCDLVLVCVNDDAIKHIISLLPKDQKVAYTSGSKNLKEVGNQNTGVFYPLQTFTKHQEVNLFEVPFFIEAKDTLFAKQLLDLAWKMSRKVEFADSEKREKLHIAAVFANNFANHMFYLAENFLDKSDISFEHLVPLILESSKKLKTNKPKDIQTGPAVREDLAVIKKHLEKLSESNKEIYRLITESIIKTKHEKL